MEWVKKHGVFLLVIILSSSLYLHNFFNHDMPAHDISSGYWPNAETLRMSIFEYGDIWPLWSPFVFSGTPFLGDPTHGIDSPVGLFLLLLRDSILAIKLSYVLVFMLAGINMYFLVNYFGVERKYALVSAIIYMFNGHILSKVLPWGWLATLGGYSFLPLLFLTASKAIKEKEWVWWSVISGIVFAVLFRLGTDMKVGIWAGVILGMYLIYYSLGKNFKTRVVRMGTIAIIIMVIFFGLSAQRALFNKERVGYSSRDQTDWGTASGRPLLYSSIPKQLIEPVTTLYADRQPSDDRIGTVGFILVGLALWKRWKNRRVMFFSIVGLFSIFLASNTFNLYYFFWKFVPLFSSLRYMNRTLFLFVFAASVLAGFGARELFKILKVNRKWGYYVLIGLLFVNLLFMGKHIKYEQWQDARISYSSNPAYQYMSGQDGLFRITNWEIRGTEFGIDYYTVPNRLEHIYRYGGIWDTFYMNEFLGLANRDPAKLWGVLNLRYMTAQTPVEVPGFTLIEEFEYCQECYQDDTGYKKALGTYLYENERFLPRAYVTQNAILVIGDEGPVKQTAYALLLQPGFEPANAAVVVGKPRITDYTLEELRRYRAIFLTSGGIDQSAQFLLTEYVNNGGTLIPDVTKGESQISDASLIELFSSLNTTNEAIDDSSIVMHDFDTREIMLDGQDGFLVYSEKFANYGGWEAYSNKEGKDLMPANVIVSGVWIDPSDASVTYVYKPKSVFIGGAITLVTGLLLLIYFGYVFWKKKISKKGQLQPTE